MVKFSSSSGSRPGAVVVAGHLREDKRVRERKSIVDRRCLVKACPQVNSYGPLPSSQRPAGSVTLFHPNIFCRFEDACGTLYVLSKLRQIVSTKACQLILL